MLRKGMFLADRYEILEQIGAGGMSDVYKAKCHKLNRNVAIKVLKPEFSQDKNFVSKFRAEAQSAAGLTHSNIVNVYDVGDEEGIHYIVMELIEGITLKKYIEKRGKIPYKEAVSIAIQVANGIEAAHRHHIIHRDIKPQNIIISKDGRVKVTDFGIAKAASTSTINSSAMGSVHYISPEQARGGYSDERSDIYSFGITLFEMLTGTVPFDGDSTVAVAVQHIQDDIPAPSTVTDDIPISIDKIVLKCTQKKTERRYQSASELIVDLKKSLVMPDEDFVKMAPPYATKDDNKDDDIDILDEDDEDDEDLLDTDDDLDDDLDEKDNNKNKIKANEADIDDESNDKLDKILKWIGIGIIAVIIIIAIFLVVKFVGGSSSNNKETTTAESTTTAEAKDMVKVPDLKGLTEEQAKKALNDVNLGYKASYQSSDTIAEGSVISQGTKAGTSVAKNTTITVSVSTGKGGVNVNNVVGKTEADARTSLKDQGFSVSVDYAFNDTVTAGVVISQSPNANTTAANGATISIVVSKGKETKNATVPKLDGLTVQEAIAKLQQSNLGYSVDPSSLSSSDYGTAKVVSQNYNAEVSVPEGTVVTIHAEMPSKQIPSVLGKTQADAESTLKASGFTVTLGESGYSDTYAKGTVMSQTTGSAAAGSTVTIVLSLGKQP
jgi:serine/threonine-protein kinase